MLKDSVKASLPSLEKVIAALQSRPRENPGTTPLDPSNGRPTNNFNLEDRYMHLDVHQLPGVDPMDIQSKLSPGFSLSTPEKNSRTPQLKKSETQENNSKPKQKSSFSGIF